MNDRLAPRQIPAGGIAGRIAGRISDLAEQVRRLDPPPDHDAERFKAERSDLAGRLEELAQDAKRRLED